MEPAPTRPPDPEDELATPEEIQDFIGHEEKEAEVREFLGFPKKEDVIQVLEKAQIFDRDGAKEGLRRHIYLLHEWNADIGLLWCAQGYLKEVLPDCVHLSILGPKSSGKSKATRIFTTIAGGTFLEGGTLASIRRAFKEAPNGVVGIDEVDANIHHLPELEHMLREAVEWDAKFKSSEQTKKGWKNVDIKVGGPKICNVRSRVEDAVGSRAFPLEMTPRKDARLTIRNKFLGNPISSIGDWLRNLCAEKVKRWTPAKVEELMKSEGFIERLNALPIVLSRDHDIAANFLAIADILGWDLDASIQAAVQAKQDQEESYEDVRQALVSFYELADHYGSVLKSPVSEVHASVNAKLKDANLRSLSPYVFAKIRREFGWVKGENDRKERALGNKVILTWDRPVLERLGIEDAVRARPLEKDLRPLGVES